MKPFFINSRLAKSWRFITSSNFRSAKFREWVFPIFRKIYPNVVLLGLQTRCGNLIISHATDKYITKEYMKYGYNSTSKLKKTIEIIRKLGIPSGGWFVDVGANIGSDTVEALESGFFSSALAIEPEERNFQVLNANIALRGFGERVRTRRIGASNKDEVRNLVLSQDNFGDHRFGDEDSLGTRVPLSTLNSILANANIDLQHVSLVWIDAQGFEGYILAGASDFFKVGLPFVVEFWPNALRSAGCYDVFVDMVINNFTLMYDLSENIAVPKKSCLVTEIASRLADRDFVDLLLLP